MVKVNSSTPVSAFQVYSKAPLSKKIKKKNQSAPIKIKKRKLVDDDVILIKEPNKDDELVINVNKNVMMMTKKKKAKKTFSHDGVDNSEAPSVTSHHKQANGKKQQSKHKQANGKQQRSDRSEQSKHKQAYGKQQRSSMEESKPSSYSHIAHSPRSELYEMSSIERGQSFLANLIAPVTVEEFMGKFWEKCPMVVNRNEPDYFNRLDLTTGSLDSMLRNNNLRFTKNIDITSYVNGKRETHNPEGRAAPAEVWDFYNNDGCSVRWLNPQTYSTRLCALCSALQEYFGCFVGANIYLTPPASQGFAPHYDDIEAFILQLEGRKHWRLYKPIHQRDVLPRYSSGNFSAEEIGEPYLEVTLEAGDVLYFPRGVIHQAVARDCHSLHVTLSCYQRNSWADLLEQILPAALSKAVSEDSVLRSGLPIGHLNHVGVANADLTTDERSEFLETTRDMIMRVLGHLNVDAAADKLAKRFMEDSLPPVLTDAEKKCSSFDDGDRMLPNGQLVNMWEMDDSTMIKLTRAHCIRLMFEDGNHRLYHTMDNTREYHEEQPGFFELVPKMVPCVKALIRTYPDFIPIGSIPLDTLDERVQFVAHLWQKGILLTKSPVGGGGEDNSD